MSPGATERRWLDDETLSSVLSILLPTRAETLLLQGCLWPGEAGRAALREWIDGNDAEPSGLLDSRALAPLVDAAIARRRDDVESELRVHLRTSRVWEELRWNHLRLVLGEVLDVVNKTGVRGILVDGAALAELVYPSPDTRHVDEVVLLAEPPDARRLAGALAGRGFEPQASLESGPVVKHGSDMLVKLRTRLFDSTACREPLLATLLDRSQLRTIADQPIRVLAPADALLRVCGAVAAGTRGHDRLWVTDLCFLIGASPELDWGSFLQGALQRPLAPSLAVILGWLRYALDIPIPGLVLDRLRDAARSCSRVDRDVAVLGAKMGSASGLRDLMRRPLSAPSKRLLLEVALRARARRWRGGQGRSLRASASS